MDWQESDSEDGDIPETQAASGKRSRSSRACDNCRKTKSKCERGASEGTPCKSCALSGTTCTFLGPSFKRGPPKGYIRAIEQRWHQVESLLGVILQCTDPRVQGVVADLRQDDLAREILNRVDQGPYGPSGRRFQPQGATKEDFFASVLRSNGSTVTGRDQSRSRRQSRVSREKVSLTQDRGLSVIPTQDWQDNLAARLCSSSPPQSYNLPASLTSDGPATQRRRLDSPSDPQGPPNWNDMYTFDAQSGDEKSDEITEGMGELSLTENQEIRYHGKTSGLQFLSKNNRTDDRVEGGVWKMPMARVWPPSKQHAAMTVQEENIEVKLPPIDVQTNLVDLYFSYIHPVFPVINKSRFLSEFNARKNGQTQASTPPGPSLSSSPNPESSQKVTNLLLLTMFSITARFCGDVKASASPQMWEGGAKHFEQAMIILRKIIDRSRPSTVQSLLLLGYREFGLGSMEQGWIYIGMAIRMAIDLGLHRNSDSWKQHGHNLFSKDETQTRRQIWWACCLADRYGSVYMGRPIIIRDEDFDTPLPEVEEEDQELWSPLASDPLKISYSPTPCHTIACQRATGDLILILGRIITKLYPITVTDTTSRRTFFHTFEMQLDQWYLNLPDALRFDVASKRKVPPPQVLLVHIRYWGTVLLLNRAFIPNWRGIDFSSRRASLELKAFDLASGAATHLSATVTAWREKFTLKRCSPFLTAYMLSTGIMHLLTLTLRPSNVQASHGLRQCLDALQDMAYVWPSASRAIDLLSGVRLGGGLETSHYQEVARTKRQVDEAFGVEKTSDYSQRELFPTAGQQPPIHQSEAGVADLSQQIMAHMLGLDIPGVEPLTYYPGYEWWPRQGQQTHAPMAPPNTAQPRLSGDLNIFGGSVGWVPDGSMNVLSSVSDYNYNYNQYNQYGQL